MRSLFLAVSLSLSVSAATADPLPVDLELVLAVDTSRSMDYDELVLQREGYAAALEHPAVTSALTMGFYGRAAITYFEWGGPGASRVLVDWTLIENTKHAADLAAHLRRQPVSNMRGTSISGAMEHAASLLDSNDYIGTRQVIDISGDGPNNMGAPVTQVRDQMAAAGIEVNGLPFMVKETGGSWSIPDLDFYYEDCVITGDAAFVIPIHSMDRLVVSIRQKLVLEIAGLRSPAVARVRKVSQTDCLIGEKLRRQRINGP